MRLLAETSSTIRAAPADLRQRVLVVDDDEDVLRLCTWILGKAGYDVRGVAGGEGALEALRLEPFDLVVSDIAMPRMDGIGLLRAIRQLDAALPVVLITGGPQLETAVGAVEGGAARYLTKPVKGAELCEAVRTALLTARGPRARALKVLGKCMDSALQSLWIALQPIVSTRRHRLLAFEALLRTDEPTLVRPHDFVLAAEMLRRLEDLGRAVRARVAAAIPGLPHGTDVFVNLHPSDLEDPELHDPRSPLSRVADRVVLELTERASLETVDAVPARIESLRKLGFRIAVDDLGAGHAGLSSLALVEPDFVKIDMSLIRKLDERPKQRILVRLIIECSHELRIPVIAEGIETARERQTLTSLGCDLLQGYLLGKPERDGPALRRVPGP